MPARLCRVIDFIIPEVFAVTMRQVIAAYTAGPPTGGFAVPLIDDATGLLQYRGQQNNSEPDEIADVYSAMGGGTPPSEDIYGDTINWGANGLPTIVEATAACVALRVVRTESALPPNHWQATLSSNVPALVSA